LSRSRWVDSQGLKWFGRRAWPAVVLVGVIVVLWAIAAASGIWSDRVLPSPATVWSSFWSHVSDGTIPTAAGKTLLRLAFGFGVAIVFGTVVGFGLVASSFARKSVGSLLVGLQAIPPIAFLPLALVWFGFSERAVVFVEIVGALPSVALGTLRSVRQVSPLLQRAGRTLGAQGRSLYRSVMFPAALPGYLAGLQQAWGFAWRALLAGELITHTAAAFGLGQLLFRSQKGGDTPEVLAVLAVIIFVGMVVDLLIFGSFERRMRHRRGLTVG
jgi:sulfonate transport system permease protein